MRFFKQLFAWTLVFSLCFAPACALSRDELRSAYRELAERRTHESPYREQADLQRFSTCGSLTDAALQETLDYLNFLRGLAGLDEVALSPLYNLRSQNGAALLAANDELNHHPEIADGMSDALYESAYLGTSLGNIAMFNWMRPEILLDGVEYFVRDDGDGNLSALGHRRWLLNPYMKETGFGLANAESGMSYVVMYAVDDGNSDAPWEQVCWPSGGAFPVELMRRDLAWSVSLNEGVYDLSSSPTLTLTELQSGAAFHFDYQSRTGDGFCLINTAGYGAGSCLIFRPDLAAAGIAEYVQNQRWQVEISGLRRLDGSSAEIRYTCDMVSLNPQEAVNVEIAPLSASLSVGETLQLSASVIPAYADDLSLRYTSSAPAVASVDAHGLVTALSRGSCTVTVATVNGRADFCELTVF